MSVALALILPVVLAAHQGAPGADELRVERAVARYARSRDSLRALGFENGAQSFDTPEPQQGSQRPLYRPSSHLAFLLQDLQATEVRLSDSIFCGSAHKAGCVQSVVRIGRPLIAGDSATVWLYAYDALNGQGSISAAITATQILLRRRDSSWAVIRALQSSESLLGRDVRKPRDAS